LWIARSKGDQFLRFDGILIGSMIPLIRDSRLVRRVFNSRHAALLIFVPCAFVVLVLICLPVTEYLGPTKPVVSGLTAAIIAYLIVGRDSRAAMLFHNPLLRHFGKISYGLYLYHFPIAALMYVNGIPPTAMFVVGLVVSIPIA